MMKDIYLILLFINIAYSLSIYIGSTGLLFPYSLGSLAYIKNISKNQQYNMIGVSGGSWCSLIYYVEKNLTDHDYLWDKYIGNERLNIFNRKCMENLQQNISKNILNNDIDFINLPVCFYTTNLKNLKLKNIKIDSFDSKNEMISIAKCSSYIPFLCGKKMFFRYNKSKYIDGVINHKVPECDYSITTNRFSLREKLYVSSRLNKNISKILFEKGWKDAENRFAKLKK